MSDVTIMYSGGLDSLIAYHFANKIGLEPFCVYVDLGHPYAVAEWKAIAASGVPVEPLSMVSLYGLIGRRMTNQIIPSRNVLLATIGGMFSPVVWINALDGEQNGKEHDKSEKFFAGMTNMLTFTNDFFQKETKVESPFAHMSKAETIKWALSNGVDIVSLFNTTSCYSGTKCGTCLTCYKRYTAFLLNGIEEPGYLANPMKSDYAKEVESGISQALVNNDYSRFTKKRCAEHMKLMKGKKI